MVWDKSSIRHLDLFSGIGGFAYAAKTVWGDRYENAGFCEIDLFCQAVLRKNFPDCQVFGDIRTLADNAGKRLEGGNGQEQALALDIGRVDLVTGGFPCQPFSAAGRRRGTDDDRYLWPEMFAVIQRFQPSWVIAENVGGLVTWNGGLVLEQVCADLESEGYEVQPFIIPAVAVNAPHRRDRVWIVACNTKYAGQHGTKDSEGNNQGGDQRQAQPNGIQQPARPSQQRILSERGVRQGNDATDTISKLSRGKDSGAVGDKRRVTSSGRPKSVQPENWEARSNNRESSSPDWNRDWKEVALATCYDGMDARISPWLDYFLGGLSYANAYETVARQDLRTLLEAIQSQEVQWPTGGRIEVPTKEVLLRTLRWFQRRSETTRGVSEPSSSEIPQEELRKMRQEVEAIGASQGRQQSEQYARELTDALPTLPFEVALEVTQIWNCIRLLSAKFPNLGIIVLPDGTRISQARWRKEAIKAYGNAIVPQVAIQIMEVIKEV